MHLDQTPSLLVLAYDTVGPRMAGPAIRSWELARAAGRAGVRVTLADSAPVRRECDGVQIVHFSSERELRQLLATHDAVLFQGLAVHKHPILRSTEAVRIVDMYDPWVLENLDQYRSLPVIEGQRRLLADAGIQKDLLGLGDTFICASERQRDYWLGMLTGEGRLTPSAYADDTTLRSLIDVVPFGCPASSPPSPKRTLRSTLGIGEDSFVMLWSGGVWEWFDPILALDALAQLRRHGRDAHLVFLGLSLENQPTMPIVQQLNERLRSPELSTCVHIGSWVPYDERLGWLCDADVALVLTRSEIESRMAFRSRVIDHLWAGLPTVTTGGDVLSDQISAAGAGWVTRPGEAEPLSRLLDELISEPARLQDARASARSLSEAFTWDSNVGPIVAVASHPQRWRDLREGRPKNPFGYGLRRRRSFSNLPSGFHSRGFIIDAIKLSPLGPVARWVRRTTVGTKIWGPVS